MWDCEVAGNGKPSGLQTTNLLVIFGKQSWQMTDLVAVYPADPGVKGFQELLLDVSLLFPPRVVQVVGVNDANHMVKLVSPALAMVIPVQVLRFLKHSHIRLQAYGSYLAYKHPDYI